MDKPEVVIEGPGVVFVTAALQIQEDEEETCRCGNKDCPRMAQKRKS